MIRMVMTKNGVVQGVESNAGFSLFRGIPFAKPPVGEL
ncbi:MAG: carboxylesterase family protein [Erysipelotrichaceae bacterium]|nr:carboxylesterase family protein [Erysipelotrichaceae bacterium]